MKGESGAAAAAQYETSSYVREGTTQRSAHIGRSFEHKLNVLDGEVKSKERVERARDGGGGMRARGNNFHV